MNWKELSDTTKALIYLSGVVASAFVGGAIAIGTLRPILDAPDQISGIRNTLETKIEELEVKIATLARSNEELVRLTANNLSTISALEKILQVTHQTSSGTSESSILNQHSVKLNALPEFSSFALSSDLPDFSFFALKAQIPDLSGYARVTQLPEMSQYAKKSDIPAQPDLNSYLKSGDRITVQGVSGKYLFDLDSRNRDEIDVIMSSTQEWRIRKSE